MHVRIFFSGLWSLLLLFAFSERAGVSEHAFNKGELLTYKLNYGWLTIGRGNFGIDEQPKEYQEHACYSVTAKGNTTGLLGWLAPVEDEWGALVRMDNLIPLYTYRNIREGGYQLNEEVFINPDLGTLTVETEKPHRKVKRRPTKYYEFDTSDHVYDLLSGLMAIRNVDFEAIQANDTLELRAFFEDKFYDFQLVFAGREVLKTKMGRIKALKLIPLMPDNSVFDGKRSLTAWFSDDKNKLPLRISAKMFIGKASAELISYQNIKYGLGSE